MSRTIEINGKKYTEEEIKETIQGFKDAWKHIAEIVSETIVTLTKAITKIISYINEKETIEHNHHWQVPKIIPMTNQVLDRKPILPNIRNSI